MVILQAAVSQSCLKFPGIRPIKQHRPEVKQWLICLENGRHGTPNTKLVKRIRQQLKHTQSLDSVQVRRIILAEASVGAVISFVKTP